MISSLYIVYIYNLSSFAIFYMYILLIHYGYCTYPLSFFPGDS